MLISAELSPRCPPAQIAEHARSLEECGFHRIWVRDMFATPWELWTAATAIALSTEKIRIGVDVTNPYTRSPVVTAHAAATVDILSGGRLDLGLGKGIPEFLKQLGLTPQETALEEAVQVIGGLLLGRKICHQGDAFSIRDVRLASRSSQERLPIWIAAMDKVGFQLGGRLADGVLTISARRPFLQKALGWLGKPVPLATWLPYSTSREELASYLDDLLPRFPVQVLEVMGLDKEWVTREELLDSFAVCGPYDLEEKKKRLAGLGVSEIILEYFSLEALRDLQGILAS